MHSLIQQVQSMARDSLFVTSLQVAPMLLLTGVRDLVRYQRCVCICSYVCSGAVTQVWSLSGW